MLRNIFVAIVILWGIGGGLIGGPFYALCFYLWNAYFRPEQWVYAGWIYGLHLSWAIGIGLIGLTLASAGKLRPKWTSQTALLLAFFAQTLFSTVSSTDFDYSWYWWAEFAKLMIIGYLISLHVDSPERLRVLIVVIAVSLGFEATKQGLAQLLLNPGGRNTNEHPVLGDNNGVAVGLFMLAPFMLALANTAERRWEKWGWWTASIGIVYRGISTYSRGGLLAAGAIGVVHLSNSRRKFQAIVLVVLASAIILSVMPQQFWDRMNTIDASTEERDASASSRLYFWSVATRMASDKPLTGVGFNAFSRNFDAYDTTNGLYGFARAVHSTWFGILAEVGIPGLVLLVLIVGRAFLACRRSVKLLKPYKDKNCLLVLESAKALQNCLIAYVVGGSFINAHYSELFWHFAWLSIPLEALAKELSKNAALAPSKVVPLRPAILKRHAVAR